MIQSKETLILINFINVSNQKINFSTRKARRSIRYLYKLEAESNGVILINGEVTIKDKRHLSLFLFFLSVSFPFLIPDFVISLFSRPVQTHSSGNIKTVYLFFLSLSVCTRAFLGLWFYKLNIKECCS
ncbi:hypothetical protein BD560DRAFT_386586 [Blakeslea trispora]|nr:hypothetical protein BD560DRAFT_386586 [Blakeslea trispora]